MYVLEVNNKSLFIKMKEVYPECEFLIEDESKLFPFICLISDCHRNANCMEKLANRVKYIFDQFESAELLVLYFRYRDFPKRHRAGVFWRDMREPRYIVMNPYSWERLKMRGIIYEWELPSSLFLRTSSLVQLEK